MDNILEGVEASIQSGGDSIPVMIVGPLTGDMMVDALGFDYAADLPEWQPACGMNMTRAWGYRPHQVVAPHGGVEDGMVRWEVRIYHQ